MITAGLTFIPMRAMIFTFSTMRDLGGVLDRDIVASAEEGGKNLTWKEHMVESRESSMVPSLGSRYEIFGLFPIIYLEWTLTVFVFVFVIAYSCYAAS